MKVVAPTRITLAYSLCPPGMCTVFVENSAEKLHIGRPSLWPIWPGGLTPTPDGVAHRCAPGGPCLEGIFALHLHGQSKRCLACKICSAMSTTGEGHCTHSHIRLTQVSPWWSSPAHCRTYFTLLRVRSLGLRYSGAHWCRGAGGSGPGRYSACVFHFPVQAI